MKKIAARKNVKDLKDYLVLNNTGEISNVVFVSNISHEEVSLYIKDLYGDIACIETRRSNNHSFDVGWSKADTGYGPLIYDWAIETLTAQNMSLGCDLIASVSDGAKKVWDFYLHQRSDVQAIPRFKWDTYKTFLYSIRELTAFGSLDSILRSANKNYLVEQYPELFGAIEFGIQRTNFRSLWEEYELFKENAEDHLFFDWVENQGVFYSFKKQDMSITKQIQSGVQEGWITTR